MNDQLENTLSAASRGEAVQDINFDGLETPGAEEAEWLRRTLILAVMFNGHRQFFDTLAEGGVLCDLYPRIDAMREVPAGPEEYHKEGSTYEHTTRVVEEYHSRRAEDLAGKLAALGHDFGKINTDESELPSHPGHDQRGVPIIEEFGERLGLRDRFVRVMKSGARQHMKISYIGEMNATTLLDMRKEMELTIGQFLTLCEADNAGREPASDISSKLRLCRERLKDAEHVLETVTRETILEDIDASDYSTEQIENIVRQNRVERLRARIS